MAPRWQWFIMQNEPFDPNFNGLNKFHPQVSNRTRTCTISIFDTIERTLADKKCQIIDISDTHDNLFLILTPLGSHYAKCIQNHKYIIDIESLLPVHVSKMLKSLTLGRPLVLQFCENSLVTTFDIIDAQLTTYATLILFETQNLTKQFLLVIGKQGYNKPYKKIINALRKEYESTELYRFTFQSQQLMPSGPFRSRSNNKSEAHAGETFNLMGHFLQLYAIGVRDTSKWLEYHQDPVLIHEFRIALQKSSNILQILIGFYELIDLGSVNDEIRHFRRLSSPLRDLELLSVFINRLIEQPKTSSDFYQLANSICVDLAEEYLIFITNIRTARFENLISSMLRLAGRCSSLRFTELFIPDAKINHKRLPSNAQQNENLAAELFQTHLFDNAEIAASKIQYKAANLSSTASIDSLHNLRKDIRKLRYTIELLATNDEHKPTLKLISRLREAQSVLGNHHDLYQWNQLITTYCINWSIDRLKLQPLNDEISNQLHRDKRLCTATLKIFTSIDLRAEVRLTLGIGKK